ncbi:hypothetical protein MMC31_007166, partial [Peltigera leucophlebia]|nr:hypothetical protein [Peltigera leucophlebia]
MGTPHQGSSGVHLGELVLNVASIFVTTNNEILQHLERDSEWLQQQLGQYAPISRDFVTKFAYEILPTPIAFGRKLMIVPRPSAIVPGAADAESIAIPADHLNMVKFASREDGGYEKVSEHLFLLAEDAPEAISTRWIEQDKIKQANGKEKFSVPFSLSGVLEVQEFIGRKEELIRIKKAFQGGGSKRKVVLLHGLGGIGKTQLAVASMKEHRDNYSAIFWLNGKNEDLLRRSFAKMAKRLYTEYPSSALLRRAIDEKDANQVVAAIKQWLSIRGNSQWILVFDNVDNPKLPGISDPQAYEISSYFPEAHHGSILITTRSSNLKIGEVVSVKKLLDIQECIAILASTSGREGLDQAPDPCAIDLVKQLDGLPLALATAGAYLSQVSISLKNYLYYYRSSWLRLQQTTPDLLSYEDRALYTTWDLSFQHIQRQNKSAEKLLQLWAYFDNQDLWFELLAAGKEDGPEWFSTITSDELCFIEVTRLLCDHALIEPVNSSGGYSMHTCVHAWAVHVLNAEKEIPMARLALKCVGLSVPTKDIPQYWAIEQRLFPHASRCLEDIRHGVDMETPDNGNINRAIHRLGGLYADQDRMQEAEALFRRALEGYEKAWGPEHTSTLDTVNNLGVLYADQGKMPEAEAMYRRALEGYEKAWGPEHTSTLNTVNNL